MRIACLLAAILLVVEGLLAQDPKKTRTRIIDYAKYDQLVAGLGYSADKTTAIRNLLAFSSANFTPEDEEYFNVRSLASTYASQFYDNQRAMELVQEGIDAFEKNYPFFNRGYATVTNDQLLQAWLTLARYEIALNLFDKAISWLESKRNVLEPSKSFTVSQQFYSLYAQALLGAERYDDAIAIGLKLRDLTEAGVFALPAQNPDDLYKIDPSYPQETKDMMVKAKAQYVITMKESQASLLSTQRMDYNRILSEACYRQFQYPRGVPYMKAMADEMMKMMAYSKKAMATSQEQLRNTTLADSVRKQMTEAAAYLDKITDLGVSSAFLIIAASKSGQPDIASSYAYGKVEKALLYQMRNQQAEAEQNYQASFAMMKNLSSLKFASNAGDQYYKAYRPFYINLQVQEGNLNKAYTETLDALTLEETSLKKNFQYFTESEKKEFFKAYNLKLARYYSLLLLMTEKKDDRTAEILDKVLQTKGIILDVTLSQEKQLKKITDKAVREQVKSIRKLRDRLAGFYQLSLKTPGTAISDSVNAVSLRINALERKVNEKLGVVPDILKPVSWKDVQRRLKNGEVYVEILRLKRDNFLFDKPITEYWAFAITTGDPSPSLFKLSDGEAFEDRGLKNYQNRMRGELEDNDSYKLYWAAIADHYKTASRIILSEDGAYHMINPLTLKNPTTGKYLLNEISLTRVSTGRDFLNLPSPPVTNMEIALIGNPTFDMSRKGGLNHFQGNEFDRMETDLKVTRDGMMPLPGTLKEVDSIGSMAEDNNVKTNILKGTDATEAKVKALRNQQVLHLATHGAFDKYSRADGYLRARLILAGAGDAEPFTMNDYATYEDGSLTAYEVTQLDLAQTNLVVLSACETGTGEVQDGEGVWGLQRAFQLAGARTVMGSLWKISDDATVVFMTAFYKKYLHSSDIDIAYKEAMQATMAAYPHPYYWGAFTLTGVQ